MRLLIVVDSLKGGAGNIAQIIAQYFKSKEIEVYLMLNDLSSSRYDLTGINLIKQKQINSLNISSIIVTSKEINSINPNIIISFMYKINVQVLLSQMFTKIPIIISERTNPYQLPKNPLGKFIRNIIYHRASKIIVQFDFFKEFMNLEKGRIIVIPNVILKSNYKHKYDSANIQRTLTFVTFGSKNPCKRLDLMIRLFCNIRKTCKNTVLKIYGDAVNIDSLKKLINDLDLRNSVFLEKRVNNVHEILASSDIYLMTSFREGFPNSLSEAMAVGIPSIAFKCHNGLCELIRHGENGFLIDEGNYQEFCRTAINLVSNADLRRQIGLNARFSIRQYDYNSIFPLWDNILLKKT